MIHISVVECAVFTDSYVCMYDCGKQLKLVCVVSFCTSSQFTY